MNLCHHCCRLRAAGKRFCAEVSQDPLKVVRCAACGVVLGVGLFLGGHDPHTHEEHAPPQTTRIVVAAVSTSISTGTMSWRPPWPS
jgi:hypothetical protein